MVRQCSFVRIYCSDTGHNSQQMFWSFQLCGCFSELCWKCQIYNKLLCRIWWAMLWGTLLQKIIHVCCWYAQWSTIEYFVERINFSYWAINQAKVMVYNQVPLHEAQSPSHVLVSLCRSIIFFSFRALSVCWHHQADPSSPYVSEAHWTIRCLDNGFLFPGNLKA